MPSADWNRPSPRLRQARHLEAGLATALAVLVAGGAFALASLTRGVIAAACILAAGALLDLALQRRVSSWGYLPRAALFRLPHSLPLRRTRRPHQRSRPHTKRWSSTGSPSSTTAPGPSTRA